MSRRLWAGLLLLEVGAVAGCQPAPPPVVQTKPAVVLVSKPVTQEITDSEEFTGRTDSFQYVEIRARVNGYLDGILFTDGSETTEGKQLFQIDPRPYQAEVDRTEAALDQAEAHQKKADADHKRSVSLFNRGVQSREDFDRVTGDFEEARAAVGVARANNNLARLNLNFTKVTAPISGRLSRKQVDKGNLIQADQTILTSIVREDPMYVYFDVDERTLLKIRRLIREDQMKSRNEAVVPVQVAFADEKGFPHKGIIDFTENRVDPSTGTLRVRGVIENPQVAPNKPRFLSPGLFVRCRLPLGEPRKSLLIPEQAVGTDQGRKFLYIINAKGEVTYRPVEVGTFTEGLRVVTKGLEPDEQVVVSGLQRIRPGAKVEAKLADATMRAPADKPGSPRPAAPKADASKTTGTAAAVPAPAYSPTTAARKPPAGGL